MPQKIYSLDYIVDIGTIDRRTAVLHLPTSTFYTSFFIIIYKNKMLSVSLAKTLKRLD